MCGIWAFIKLKKQNTHNMTQLFQDFYQLKHRGPDNSYFETYHNVILGFHRLAIMDDTFSSNQPFIYEDNQRTVVFICNGEIYNYRELIQTHELPQWIQNDCRVLPEVYWKFIQQGKQSQFTSFIQDEVKGEFAFLLFEFDRLKNLKKVMAYRDPIGIRPLYYSPYSTHPDANSNCLFFTSELKGGLSFDGTLEEFPPGYLHTYEMDEFGTMNITRVHTISIPNYDILARSHYCWSNNEDLYLKQVYDSVTNSVRRRLCSDKPLAFLLSGGVDSSLVAAISANILNKPIRTFCCGMNEGTDLLYARMVAKHIGSNHTEVLFTPEEALQAIPDVIRTIESWDTTTVRASVGQYLVSKYIGTQTDCKVVMVGEGPDEVCSSYLFNWYAPDGTSLDETAREYVHNIHYYDVKRADRCISRWGLEGRVPLLDTEFIHSYWNIPPEQRMPTYKNMEKWWLRKAFEYYHILPKDVLWRKKEAFSDGVSGEKSWFQIIQEWVEDKVTEDEMKNASDKYPYCTPKTKEAYYYRKLFCEIFGEHRQKVIPAYWQPKWNSDGSVITEYIDPSARVLSIYKK
ncbi:MAG: asparagine synthase-related protein [Minisyncoccia bacterium]